jgi:lipopolysaccharide/colanic/teichoic acid biosynthesis glycosyltransferase
VIDADGEGLGRWVDGLCAAAGLILLSPVLAGAALAVKLSSPGPVLHRAVRVGRAGNPFAMLKFRTMVLEAVAGPGITSAEDPRVTPVGHVLRRWKLDELPQLVNVLRGEMSLVGPRPEDPRYVARYTPEQRRVLRVRPGLTSPASLRFFREESMLTGEDWETAYLQRILPAKLSEDLEYLEHRSARSDLTILIRSVWKVAKG